MYCDRVYFLQYCTFHKMYCKKVYSLQWLQLFADHPNLICVVLYIFLVSYILHSSDVDYYFIYTSLHNAVLQSNIIFIEGGDICDDIY